MDIAVVDLEATGLDVDTVAVHCIVIQVPGHGPLKYRSTMAGGIDMGIGRLNRFIDAGYTLAGHNIIEYDIPILRRLGMKDPGSVLDTLVMSRAAYPGSTLYAKDQAFLMKHPDLRDEMRPGAHSLKAWGLRIGEHKGDYDGGWEHFSQEMLDYCVQDVATNTTVLDFLRTRIPDEASILECDVATICRRMRLTGVAFNVAEAEGFTVTLAAKRALLTQQLREAFGVWFEPGKMKIPKRSQTSKKYSPGQEGYVNTREGCEHQGFIETEFNPASTDHIAKRLTDKYGWKPTHYTETGKPQVTADILRDLDYPEAPLLADYQEIKKILGYVAEGTGAWLKLEEKGRIHGKVNPTGTVSGRASHSRPNTGNVPSRSDLGHSCRALFGCSPGRVLVGADASGLQLRILAHYLAKWDGGAFARQCETGDIHEYMREATGLYTRAHQKTWTYAKLFGAGAGKLGQTAIVDHRAALAEGLTEEPVPHQKMAGRIGAKTLANLGDAIPAFTELEAELKAAAKRGWLTTLDGRRLPISSEHIAIAMLLQGGEAIIMKQAMVYAYEALRRRFAEYVLWVHDEFQVECAPEVADEVGFHLVEAMQHAGNRYNLRVKIDGEYKVGQTWAETH